MRCGEWSLDPGGNTLVHLRVRAAVVGMTTLLCVSLAAGPGGAAQAPGWSRETVPFPAGASSGELTSVSCSSATVCTAVGDYWIDSNSYTLAERWNGTAWSIQSTPNPLGASRSFLKGVSCPSASACMAVGITGSTALIERWNGKKWSILTPAADTGYSNLQAVSCSRANVCTAVGAHSGSAIAERWNGSTWTMQTVPNPSGGSGELWAISCTSATACTAVGDAFYPDVEIFDFKPLAESWNGSTWAIQSLPTKDDFNSSRLPYDWGLRGVSCVTSSACTAVGWLPDFSGNAYQAFAERWDGTSWTEQNTALPATDNQALYGVSCTITSLCTAVGTAGPIDTGPNTALAEQWNGVAWVIQPIPPGDGASLTSVSCTIGGACTAVGPGAEGYSPP